MYGEKLRIIRKEAGLSQADLAKKIGVSRPNISFWENGEFPPLEAIDKVCKALNVDIWKLFTDKLIVAGPMDVPPLFGDLAKSIASLDNDDQNDILEIMNVIVSRYQKRSLLDIKIESSKDQRVETNEAHSLFNNIDNIDDFNLPYYARNAGKIALEDYTNRFLWIS